MKLRDDTLERMFRAVQRVEHRLLTTTSALEAAGIAYAVIGGNAVAFWVATVDAGATRNTPEVNVLVRREDRGAVADAMTAAGFDHRIVKGVNGFVDRPDGSERSGIYFWFAGERVRESDVLPMPELTEAVQGSRFKVISLKALVRMKLVSFRRKDQVHLQDLLRQGLLDDTWPARFPDALANRLREILADPEG